MPGYEAKFVRPLLKWYECPICLFAMKNPVQTAACGHLFCRDCLEPVLKRPHPICPIDQEDISEGIFPDNASRREILKLEVACNNSMEGCPWVGHLKEIEVSTDAGGAMGGCPWVGHLKEIELGEH